MFTNESSCLRSSLKASFVSCLNLKNGSPSKPPNNSTYSKGNLKGAASNPTEPGEFEILVPKHSFEMLNDRRDVPLRIVTRFDGQFGQFFLDGMDGKSIGDCLHEPGVVTGDQDSHSLNPDIDLRSLPDLRHGLDNLSGEGLLS
ncbi:hypothetical protein WICPIJ_006794 [Wickerhamomyces pijperi]|uniref:Uncharacterized protein n=1 Tax=Wickerhamomyces pijperi TaxID=599730 RepID=A0A9P8TL27_WICPI|nr:hypothetical protein WICPIJ_006794 [Wickerhamomyces pijperi]